MPYDQLLANVVNGVLYLSKDVPSLPVLLNSHKKQSVTVAFSSPEGADVLLPTG